MTEDKCFYYSKFVIITEEKDRAKVFCMQNADFQKTHIYIGIPTIIKILHIYCIIFSTVYCIIFSTQLTKMLY